MARGRQRIRQRGSRQQWAQARGLKAFGPDDGAKAGAEPAPAEPGSAAPGRPMAGADVVGSTRCGLCNIVVEQRLRDGRRVNAATYTLCISCDEVRCQDCWAVADDFCADDEEHEFLEVQYAIAGQPAVADFVTWV